MPEKIFKERFCEIVKIKVCVTSAELNFDTYTEPGAYEIYEDMGDGRNRIYSMTVDKSAAGACIKQTRIHCGIVDARQSTSAGTWTAWEAVTGGGGGQSLEDYVKKAEFATELAKNTVQENKGTGGYTEEEKKLPISTGVWDEYVMANVKTTDALEFRTGELEKQVGDFDAALDAAIALCDSYIGGEAE
jgi:hypothetical protein